ncbi:MAG TPA: hypothetical protein VE128_00935 [Candidatus Angelobacter sp.]|jgi:enolase|nr:hypothetical protein [Candidatus Angelobacter sp.]
MYQNIEDGSKRLGRIKDLVGDDLFVTNISRLKEGRLKEGYF